MLLYPGIVYEILFSSLFRYKHLFARASEVSVRKSFIMLVGAFNPFIHLHTMMMTSVFFTHPTVLIV